MKSTYENIETFIKDLNTERKKGKWFGGIFIVRGLIVEIKAYGTWNQILRVGSWRENTVMNLNVSGWKEEIRNAVNV